MSDKPEIPNLDILNPYGGLNLPDVWVPTGYPKRTVMFGHPRPPLEISIKTPPVESFETLEDYYIEPTGFCVVDLRGQSQPTPAPVVFDDNKMQVVNQSVLKALHEILQKAKLEDGTWVNGISEYGVDCKAWWSTPVIELTIYDWPSNRGAVLKLNEDGELQVFIYHSDPRDTLPDIHLWHLDLKPDYLGCRSTLNKEAVTFSYPDRMTLPQLVQMLVEQYPDELGFLTSLNLN